MSAGSGVRHSEFNASRTHGVHFLQIWIQPNVTDIPPSYEEKHFDPAEKRGRLRLIASPDGASGSVRIHQDALVYGGLFDAAEHATLALAKGRRAYIHVARGSVHVNDVELHAGDALKLTAEPMLEIGRGNHSEILVFDLPG
jgi:quercetin 2,3-dioxygenase